MVMLHLTEAVNRSAAYWPSERTACLEFAFVFVLFTMLFDLHHHKIACKIWINCRKADGGSHHCFA